MSDPLGGSLDFRITIERENAQAVAETRKEISGLVAEVQHLNRATPASASAVTAFAGSMFKTDEASRVGTRGVTALRGAITGLAFQATGTAGPVGRLASTLLLFAGGSSLVIGVAAGIGAIATAYKLASAEATHLKERNEELNKSWRDIVGQGRPTVQIMNQLLDAITKQSEAQEELERLRSTRPTPHGPVTLGTAGEIALAENAVSAAQRVVDAIRQQLREARLGLGDQLAKSTIEGLRTAFTDATTLGQLRDIFARGLAEIAKVQDPRIRAALTESLREMFIGAQQQLQGARRGELTGREVLALGRPLQFQVEPFGQASARLFQQGNAAAIAAEAGKEYNAVLEESRRILGALLTPQQIYNQQVQVLQRALDLGIISTQEFEVAVRKLKKAMDDATKTSPVLAASIITAVAGAIAAIAGGGGIGGILSGIGGIVGLIPGGQIAGAVIGGLGAIISSSQANRGVRIDSYSREALEQLRGLPSGPQRLLLQVISPTTGEVIQETIYELGRQERVDAAPRVPLELAVGG